MVKIKESSKKIHKFLDLASERKKLWNISLIVKPIELGCALMFLRDTEGSNGLKVYSTSRIEINVDRVRQVVCGDRRLTVGMIASQGKCLEDYQG